jgi:hypothetical protein
MLRRGTRLLLAAPIAAVALIPATARAKSIGGCPSGGNWQLVTVASLGVPNASGIPSLDGNGDGLTCIKPLPNYPSAGAFTFRDNTVGSTG